LSCKHVVLFFFFFIFFFLFIPSLGCTKKERGGFVRCGLWCRSLTGLARRRRGPWGWRRRCSCSTAPRAARGTSPAGTGPWRSSWPHPTARTASSACCRGRWGWWSWWWVVVSSEPTDHTSALRRADVPVGVGLALGGKRRPHVGVDGDAQEHHHEGRAQEDPARSAHVVCGER
jgi:hypothetical protein